MSVRMEVWGDYALFTRPECKVERISYDVPTPSAARGMLEAVYFHPGLKWNVDRIYVMNPIRFTNVRRNEIGAKASASEVSGAMKGNGKLLCISTRDQIQQRASMMLRDVRYVIEAHFSMTDHKNEGDNPGKFQDIMKRRLSRGQAFAQPYFGCRECTAHFKLWEGGNIPTIDDTRDLGWSFYDFDWDHYDGKQLNPMFYRPKMVNGVIDIAGSEVFR